MGREMEELLTFDSVEISFDGRAVVHDVSFSLCPGEILGIVGESGSGKSTLLKAAMGLLGRNGLVTRGDIWLKGKNVPDLSERQLRKLRGAEAGMIFQDAGASLCPIRTVGEQVMESISAHRPVKKDQAKAAALELFASLNLRDGERIWSSYPFELSGGMNQRVGIALSMLMKPAVLLADEPTSALDAVVQRQVVQELRGIRDRFGTAIVLVTHDIGVVSAMADRILVLQNGHQMEYGTAEQVLNAPRNAYTQKLLSAVPRIRREAP